MKSKPRRIVSWTLLVIAFVFCITVRIRLLTFPLDRDEGEYAYAGQLLLQGIPPYRLAYNMKLPGTYVAYAGLMAVFGETADGVRRGMLAVNLMTIVLLYVLTCQLFDDVTAGAAVISYSILSTSIAMFGIAAHATHFVSFFGLAGAIVLWRYLQFSDWRLAIGAGCLFGLAFLMKQQGIFLIVFGGVCLIERILFKSDSPWLGRLRDLVAFTVGAAIPYLLTCLWLWHAGVWDRFRFWTIEYAAHYVQYISWREGIDRCFKGTLGVIGGNFPLWLLAFLGLITLTGKTVSQVVFVVRSRPGDPTTLAASKRCARACWFVGGYLLFSSLCVVPSFIFRQHYYILILPPLALLCGAGCRVFDAQNVELVMKNWWRSWILPAPTAIAFQNETVQNDPIDRKREGSIQPVVDTDAAVMASTDRWYGSLIVLALAVVPTVLLQADYFFRLPPMQICRDLYGSNPFPECQTIAGYLREHTQPTDTIAVLGSEPQLYFLSQRRSATGYIYTYPIMEPQPDAHRMHEEMIREIERSAPAYIVDVQVIYSWMEQNNGEKLIFNWKPQYLQRHYERVGIVCISEGRQTIFRWDRDVNSLIPKSDGYVVVYRRI